MSISSVTEQHTDAEQQADAEHTDAEQQADAERSQATRPIYHMHMSL